MKWLHQWLLGSCSRSCRWNPSSPDARTSPSACRDGICPEKEICPVKAVLATSFQKSLSCPAGANMNLCFASRAQMEGYFSSAIQGSNSPLQSRFGFLLFTAFLPTLWGCNFWNWKDPVYTSISFRKFLFSCRIDFIQHSCYKECQLPKCIINFIKNTLGKKTLRIFRLQTLSIK